MLVVMVVVIVLIVMTIQYHWLNTESSWVALAFLMKQITQTILKFLLIFFVIVSSDRSSLL